jgi:hypothetical protein
LIRIGLTLNLWIVPEAIQQRSHQKLRASLAQALLICNFISLETQEMFRSREQLAELRSRCRE